MNEEGKWCVLGRYRHEAGTWSFVSIQSAETPEAAIRKAMKSSQIHGYYVALPWKPAARAETTLALVDAEGAPLSLKGNPVAA